MNTERLDELLSRYWSEGYYTGWGRYGHHMGPRAKELRAAIHAEVARLVAEEREAHLPSIYSLPTYTGQEIASLLHYPACWDDVAYPRLIDALMEVLAWHECPACRATPRGVDNTTTDGG